MGLVIMAYTGEVLKEYFLPALNNADYSFCLSKQLFMLPDDLEIRMEIIDYTWRFSQTEQYNIRLQNGKSCFGQVIQDGDVMEVVAANNFKVTLVAVASEQVFQVMRKYDITYLTDIFIGNESNTQIQYDIFNFISRNHAALQKNANGWVVFDMSTNGIFINSCKIHESRVLQFGDCIEIFGLRIVFLGNMIAVNQRFGSWKVKIQGLTECFLPESDIQEESLKKKEKHYYKRSPRNMETLFQETIEIEAPPALQKRKERPLFMTIGPSFTMAIPMLLGSVMAMVASQTRGGGSGAFMFTGLITAVGSAVIGVFWAISNLKYERQEEVKQREQRLNSYGQYIIDIADYLKEKYNFNQRVLNERYIPADQCTGFDERNPNLRNRNSGHEDFLNVRL